MTNRIDNEQSIGTNPFGDDWRRTALKLQKHGDRVIAGDFSSFDGTLNTSIMWEFVNVANEWYSDGPENALIRQTLFLDVVNATHLCEGLYYVCDHSQPSGNPATTVLNSFYNSVSMRMVFYLCAEDRTTRFDDVCSMVSYGDDNVVNISASVTDWFNQGTITEAYTKIGMTYTDEHKSESPEPYRRLGEVAYLKRGFVQRQGIWKCPMDLECVLETTNWIRASTDDEHESLENCAGVFQELAQHDKQTFTTWTAKINAACMEKYGVMVPRQSTYEVYATDRM